MRHLIRICSKCKEYTLKKICINCSVETIDPHPPKFSIDDKYVRYRIRDRYIEEEN